MYVVSVGERLWRKAMIDPIVASQRDLLRKLQTLTDKPILVQRHLKNIWHEWENDFPNNPFQTRSILSSELALDMDTTNWEVQKKEGEKLLAFLEQDRIPFYMAFSGGKSMHYHIFADKNTIAFPERLYQELKNHPEIDVPCLVREYLTSYIVAKTGIDSDIAELDWSNIVWSRDGQGSMIRIEGCQRQIKDPNDSGKFYTTFKTVVEDIPAEKPSAKAFSLPLKFPEKMEQWDISHLQDTIIKLVESKIEQRERNHAAVQIARLKRLTTPHISSRRKCLGFQRAEAGISKGIRDIVSTGLICAYKKWLRVSEDECQMFMNEWAGGCNPAFNQEDELRKIEYSVKKIYCMEQPYPPCSFFKRAGLCEGSQCRLCVG